MDISENRVVELWCQIQGRNQFNSEDGEPVEVIYPGRFNDGQGADFRDAVIVTPRGVIRGDIEIHTSSSDWQAHSHHRDPEYNRVVLHVALRNNQESDTVLQDGGHIPLITLSGPRNSVTIPSPENIPVQSTPCLNASENAAAVEEFLDDAGDLRFLNKVSGCLSGLTGGDPGQQLYRGIMGALGYSRNKHPFMKLSQLAPLTLLESVTKVNRNEEECLSQLQALLMGTAGLLPSQRLGSQRDCRKEYWVEILERLWLEHSHSPSLNCKDWQLFRVRTVNFPVRRIAALSYLLLKYREDGLLQGMLDLVNRMVDEEDYRIPVKSLVVLGSGYWADHFDFGPDKMINNAVLLGENRVSEIIINVILPFVFALSRMECRLRMMPKIFNLFSRYPKLESNVVEKHIMKQLGLSSRQIKTARRQQGMIYLYNSLCTQGRCSSCPLSRDEL